MDMRDLEKHEIDRLFEVQSAVNQFKMDKLSKQTSSVYDCFSRYIDGNLNKTYKSFEKGNISINDVEMEVHNLLFEVTLFLEGR